MVNFRNEKRLGIKPTKLSDEQIQKIIDKCLLKPGADLVVCDEGHCIKNQKSLIFRTVSQIESKRRIILSGTPMQNNLREFYAMVEWIKPGLLGTLDEFCSRFVAPVKVGQYKDSDEYETKQMKLRCYILHEIFFDIAQLKEVSVLKDFVAEKHDYCINVPLTKLQKEMYKQYLIHNPQKDEDKFTQFFKDYTFLRKIWTHPNIPLKALETWPKQCSA